MIKKLLTFILLQSAFSAAFAANYLTFTAEEAGSKFSYHNSEDNEPDVQYSLDDGKTWTVLNPDEKIELKAVGDKALLKGKNEDGFSMSFEHNGEYLYDYTEFRMTGKIAASGSVMSLIDGEGTSTTIPSNGCFYRLFNTCTSLTTAPELPATTLRNQCYQEMFHDCTSLTKAPELPATTLFPGCYWGMFYFCENLAETPYLPATKFFQEYGGDPSRFLACYRAMFAKCRSLKKITVNFPDWGETYEVKENYFEGNTSGWVNDVASTGVFVCPKALAKEFGDDRIPKDWTVEYIEDAAPNYLTFTAETDESSFEIQIEQGNTLDNFETNIQYSLDEGTTWKELKGNISVQLSKGDKAMLKGNNPTGFAARYKFSMIGKIAASGSVMSLLDGSGRSTVIPNENCFRSLFSGCKSLTEAPELPATTLTPYCYQEMFSGSGITKAPELPALSLTKGCYKGMFSSTTITETPELPATILAPNCYEDMFSNCANLTKTTKFPAPVMFDECFSRMFLNCTSLTQAPALPSTRISQGCYKYMFCGCLQLTQAPKLPATTLYPDCYASMFATCTRLEQAPELPATTLAEGCYANMFSGCSKLTQAPELPAKTLVEDCYKSMFSGCNLSQIKVYFTEWDDYTEGWVADLPESGTFICYKALAPVYGDSRIPNGWGIEYLDENVGVNTTAANGIAVWTSDYTIHVRGAEGAVSLYDMDGRFISTSTATTDILNLTVPAQGIYIVRTNGETFTTVVK